MVLVISKSANIYFTLASVPNQEYKTNSRVKLLFYKQILIDRDHSLNYKKSRKNSWETSAT